ncbi:exosortase A [Roseomonas haemaphysalidis]|uniref:Exosortase n=1 Tax=Roseomonas haemaphysalidis TaxID=2768162 RepID=A0ABS3KNR3_9PROT|nr:exosortase A [Roseomonas haemaphysalidis]MBO1079104.1 exosortase [Roseomonas haemaphysalidis]
MSIATQSAGALAKPRLAAWPLAMLVLAIGLAALGYAFRLEAVTAVQTWESSTAYNHCWLVLPVALWLGWSRRHRLIGTLPRPSLLAAIAAAGPALAWLLAERLGIMEGRQLAALSMVLCLVVAVLGWQFARAMAAPLLYLFFLVPFGAFLVPALQRVTAWFITSGLQVLQIPYVADDLVIEIPAGAFLVAEACAGLRFIIAALAFGALYAVVMFRSPSRRLVVLALAIIVPIVANGFRALGIVLMGHWLGSAEAAAADHVVYGWAFFSLVILLLVAAGLPFRQDGTVPAAPPPAPSTRRPGMPMLLAAAVLSCVLSLSAPAVAAALDQAGGTAPMALRPRIVIPPGCSPMDAQGVLRCGGGTLQAQLLVFPQRSTWGQISAARTRLSAADDEALTYGVHGEGMAWQVRQTRDADTTTAVATWLDGAAAGGGLRSRMQQGWNSVTGAGGHPVVLAFVWRPTPPPQSVAMGQHERQWLRQALEAQAGGAAEQAAELSRR